MATTALFVELIVIGIQGSLWVLVLLLAFTNIGTWSGLLGALVKWNTVTAVLSVALFYSFGIILDRLFHVMADAIRLSRWLVKFQWVERRIRSHTTDNVIEIYHYAGILSSFYQYIVSRWRIARATFFNAALAVVALEIFLRNQSANIRPEYVRVVDLAVVAGSALAVFGLVSFTTNDVAKEIRGDQIMRFYRKLSESTKPRKILRR